MFEIRPKLTINTPERCQEGRYCVFILYFEYFHTFRRFHCYFEQVNTGGGITYN